MTETTLVTNAADMAAILRAASPSQARHFARDCHEKACEAADGPRMQFWRDVAEALREPAPPPARPAVPSPTGYRGAEYGPHRTPAPARRRTDRCSG